jgi:hypothetical protein
MSDSYGPNLGKLINALTGDTYDVDFRFFLRAIDVLVQCAVISKTLAAPPGSPANGARYIVAGSPTGAWSGHANAIAVWTTDNPATPGGLWEFYAPNFGWLAPNLADGLVYVYSGSAWAALAGGASTFVALTDVPAAYTGAGGKAVEVNAGATALVFNAKPFDVSVFAPGVGANNQKLLRVKLARAVTFPAGAALSLAEGSANATASTTFTFSQNGTAFATVNFAAAAAAGIWTQAAAAVFAAGDLLEIDGPATADATLADVGITLAGVRS